MTTTPTTPTPDAPAESVEVAPESQVETDEAQPDEQESKTGREAAKYRTQLRAAEAERDTLRGTVEALQRSEVERLSSLSRPGALWASGVTLADVLSESGTVDPEKVKTATSAAIEALGLAENSNTPKPDPSQGSQGNPPEAVSPWEKAMRV